MSTEKLPLLVDFEIPFPFCLHTTNTPAWRSFVQCKEVRVSKIRQTNTTNSMMSESYEDDTDSSYASRSNQYRNRQRRWTFSYALLASIIFILSYEAHFEMGKQACCQRKGVDIISQSKGANVINAKSIQTEISHFDVKQAIDLPDTLATHGNDTTKSVQFDNSSPKKPKVVEWNGFDDMQTFADEYFGDHNLYCERIDQERNATTEVPLTMKISFECERLFQYGGYGTGNYISFLYGLRMASQIHENVGLEFTCTDAHSTKRNLILPWLTGWYPPRLPSTENPYAMVSVSQGCSSYYFSQTSRMAREIQYDFRRMAIGLVGVPHTDHPSAAFAQTYLSNNNGTKRISDPMMQVPVTLENPVFPKGSVELDDAVIHFRCGDLMDSDHPHFAFIRFNSYLQYISPDARSIGIVTQPFREKQSDDNNSKNLIDEEDGSQTRIMDGTPTVQDRCRTVVLALADAIRESHPHSRVQIHNGRNETISLAYARMIMANQSIAAISTFGVFPIISTFGTGYLHQPKDGPFPNSWIFHPRVDELATNVRLLEDGDFIMVKDIKHLWETQGQDGVLAWFRNKSAR